MTVSAIPRLGFPTVPVDTKGPVHVAGDEEVEPAVVVVVQEPGAGAPLSRSHSGGFRHVRERAVPVVTVERVSAEVGDVDVCEAVVVVVADRDAHAVVVLRHAGEASLLRHVGKRAIGVLVIEAVPEARARLVRQFVRRHRVIDLRAVGEEHVQAIVVVVVQQGHAAAHGLHQVLVRRRRVAMREVDAGRLRDVGEPHLLGRRCPHQPGNMTARQKQRAPRTTRPRPHRSALPESPAVDDPLGFMTHEKMIGLQVAEGLFGPRGPCEFDEVRLGGVARHLRGARPKRCVSNATQKQWQGYSLSASRAGLRPDRHQARQCGRTSNPARGRHVR